MALSPKGLSATPLASPRERGTRQPWLSRRCSTARPRRITRKAIDLALAGDLTAIRVCLDRIVPPRRDRTVAFELPRMETAADAIKALSAVAEAVAAGEISPGEGAEFGKLIDLFTRAIEASEFEERLSRLERAAAK